MSLSLTEISTWRQNWRGPIPSGRTMPWLRPVPNTTRMAPWTPSWTHKRPGASTPWRGPPGGGLCTYNVRSQPRIGWGRWRYLRWCRSCSPVTIPVVSWIICYNYNITLKHPILYSQQPRVQRQEDLSWGRERHGVRAITRGSYREDWGRASSAHPTDSCLDKGSNRPADTASHNTQNAERLAQFKKDLYRVLK